MGQEKTQSKNYAKQKSPGTEYLGDVEFGGIRFWRFDSLFIQGYKNYYPCVH